MNYYPITVVDNFYDNPDEIRKFALSQTYKHCFEIKDFPYTFPGSRTEDLSIIHPELFQKCCHKLTALFHNFDHDVMRWQITTCFQSVTKNFERGVIHHDTNTAFAAVLYLTPEPQKNSGTTLYKQGKSFDYLLYENSLKENDERFRKKQSVDTKYHHMFDEIVTVQNTYNTLIFYEGHHHHSANEFFGDSLESSRLAQVFFCHRVDGTKETAFPMLRSKKIMI
ncbi:MAG: hypothetical protein EBY16_09020 [Gammaproteobacteria bacterium]|nr:hypothetical protein [Gammaproteobacteria bacterium]